MMDLSGLSLGPSDGFQHQMGLRKLAIGQWLELGHADIAVQLEAKRALMASPPDELFIALPEAEAASVELQQVVAQEFEAQDLSPPEFSTELHPLDAAARCVREDLLIHVLANGVMTLVAGSVCFPTRWILAEKIGHPLDVIHRPVPGYEEDVARKVNTFIERLTPGPGVWRRNWSLMPTGDLCLPGRHDYLPLGTEPTDLWFRTERQTLRRLPESGAVVFTVGIDVAPLPEIATNIATAEALASTIDGLSEAFRRYKGLTEQAGNISAFLRSHQAKGSEGLSNQ